MSYKRGIRVVLADGRHGTVMYQATKPHEMYYNDPRMWCVVVDKSLDQVWAHESTFRRERFWEFLTLPTGFGKTSWPSFALIQIACLTFIATLDPVGIGAAIAIEGVLMYGTWSNFKGKQA